MFNMLDVFHADYLFTSQRAGTCSGSIKGLPSGEKQGQSPLRTLKDNRIYTDMHHGSRAWARDCAELSVLIISLIRVHSNATGLLLILLTVKNQSFIC